MLYRFIKIYEALASKNDFLGKIYLALCRGLVEKEIKEAAITFHDRVLHIGCGSFPYTALIISANTKSRVTAIDNDPLAVENALQYIKNKGEGGVEKIQHREGLNFPILDFDVILVSTGVVPKQVVLKNIYESMKMGARLIYRNPNGFMGRLFNKEVVLFNNARYIRQRNFACRKSVLVVKQ